MIKTPTDDQYPVHYRNYVKLVPEGNVMEHLTEQVEKTIALLKNATEEQLNYRYAEGKWSLQEVVGHIIDTERIQCYRILRIGRGDQTPLAGYDDEKYVEEANFSERSITSLLEEFLAVRYATLTLLKGLQETAFSKTGYANNGEMSVNALVYIIAGHELHHLKIIKEKYLQ